MILRTIRAGVVALLALFATTAVVHAQAGSLTTAAPNNGSGGVFLDLAPTGSALSLDSFATYFSSAAGTPVNVEVWSRPGSYVGFSGSNVGWTLTQTVTGVSAGTATLSAPIPLTAPIILPAGQTTAVYFHATTSGGGIRYTGTGTTAVTMYSNADLSLTSTIARTGTVAFGGTANTPRCFAGTLFYSVSNPNAMGACCTAAAQCTFGSATACTTSGGFFSGDGTSCTPNVCPHRGACCAGATNACAFSNNGAAGCAAGTTYQGDATSCSPNICPQGACCNDAAGTCTLTGPTGCPSGSTYQTNGTVCSPNPCPQPPPPANDECTGAVTLTLGTTATGGNVFATPSATLVNDATNPFCTQATWATGAPNNQKDVFWKITAPATAVYEVDTCGSAIDTILSVHSGCPIDQTNLVSCNDDSTSGAGNTACTSNGLNSRIPSVTLTAGTTYYFRVFGYNNATGAISITVNLVSATGSCCNGAACTLTDAANCSGTFTSGATCGGGACGGPAGVCCRGATCNATVAQASCTGSGAAGASFASSATTCNTSPTSNSPCCFADYNKTGGVSVQDIFDFLGDWFAGSPYARTGGDGSPGPLNVQNIFDFLTAWFSGGCS